MSVAAPTFSVMPTALETTPPSAYEIPWRIERISDTHATVINRSGEPVEFVRVFGSDDTTLRWGRLLPGDAIDLCLCDLDLDEAVVTLCWFRPASQIEYIWRFVM